MAALRRAERPSGGPAKLSGRIRGGLREVNCPRSGHQPGRQTYVDTRGGLRRPRAVPEAVQVVVGGPRRRCRTTPTSS
jgi:hypothetical protein